MEPGVYRNKAGGVLHVMGAFVGTHRVRTLGGIYEAEARDALFGTTTYLVTQESMRQGGYARVALPGRAPSSPNSGEGE
jgi:hypothetical protein